MISSTTPSARSPLHHWHRAHGARLLTLDGWEIPGSYSGVAQETTAARTALGLADISSFAKIGVQGPGLAAWIRNLAHDGRATQPLGVSLMSADGPVLACRLAEHQLLLLATSSGLTLRFPDFEVSVSALDFETRVANPKLAVFNQTSNLAGFSLVGSHGDSLLRRLTSLDISDSALPLGTCAQTSLAGVAALLVRSPELPVPSLRIQVSWDLAEYVWERVLEAGQDLGLIPLGLESWRSLLT